MSGITQCPHCKTRFRISQEQLDVRRGLVCCGRCQHAFNAKAHLQQASVSPTELPPQADLPIFSGDENQDTLPAAEHSDTQNNSTLGDLAISNTGIRSRSSVWYVAGLIFLSSAFLLQLTHFFRAEIAARIPKLAPALQGYCNLMNCRISLPQQAELLSLESSGLESSSVAANLATLSAVLHNSASFAQAYPHLQLTLTNAQGNAMGRRVFSPKDYLENGLRNSALAAGGRLEIRVNLDISDLQPVGYKLLLFYPR